MRLLEGEVRIASMTAWAPGPSLITQASNFSFFRRSAALPGRTTGSTLNCLKHSPSTLWAASFRSTKATRAAAFFLGAMGARAVPKVDSMAGVRSIVQDHSGGGSEVWQRLVGPMDRYKSGVTGHGPMGYFRSLQKVLRDLIASKDAARRFDSLPLGAKAPAFAEANAALKGRSSTVVQAVPEPLGIHRRACS